MKISEEEHIWAMEDTAFKDDPFCPGAFEYEMKSIEEMEDIEQKHRVADAILICFLRRLGYEKGCDVFDKMRKWYS